MAHLSLVPQAPTGFGAEHVRPCVPEGGRLCDRRKNYQMEGGRRREVDAKRGYDDLGLRTCLPPHLIVLYAGEANQEVRLCDANMQLKFP